jgi:hypothetical protein
MEGSPTTSAATLQHPLHVRFERGHLRVVGQRELALARQLLDLRQR